MGSKMNYEKFRLRVNEKMSSLALNQAKLSERSGITKAALSLIIGGKRKISAEMLMRLASALNTTPNYLCGVSGLVSQDTLTLDLTGLKLIDYSYDNSCGGILKMTWRDSSGRRINFEISPVSDDSDMTIAGMIIK